MTSSRPIGTSHRSGVPTRDARALSVLASAVLLAACADSGSSALGGAARGDALGLAMPDRLVQTRAVDRSALRPIVTLSTGQIVPMRRIDEVLWSGTVRVDPNTTVSVEVDWVGDLERGSLRLARLPAQRVAVGSAGGALAVGNDRYDYDLDFDGDGVANLAELEAGSDPFTGVDGIPMAPPTDIPAPTPVPDPGPDPAPDPTPDVQPGAEPDMPTGDAPAQPTVTPIESDVTPVVDPIEPVSPPVPVVPIERPRDDEEEEEEEDEDDDDEEDDRDEDDVEQTASIDVFVPRVSRGRLPDIDGEGVEIDGAGRFVGEWGEAVQVDSSGQRLSIDNLMIDLGAEAPSGTPYRRWAALHDGRHLYVVVMVEDDGERFGDSELFWQDDGVELFIDGDYGRATSYGDDDDYHLIVPLLEPGTTASQKRPNANDVAGFLVGPNSSGRGIDLDFVTGPGIGPDGIQRARFERDVYEFRIELDSIDVEPGEPFGFELQVNDDDDGGPRDSKWGWAHPARGDADVDFTYLDPSFMGTLLLD